MKEQNNEYLTLSKYASFSRRHRNDHRKMPMEGPNAKPNKN